ncbi:MAG: ACT domain-containing protein [Rhizobiaceae bacterium]|nr:ACT domain-containing protein [Hyphomicrobiales bacterium]NRB29093.1 ACT domain-containing protein [Rhizobiaceae bacterium]
MTGELNIDVLLKSLKAELVDGVYVFVTLADDAIPPNLTPRMMFREAEGTTLILEQEQADAAGIDYAFPCRMITLDVHSSLEAVGFMARIATELAKAGMGVNPVAGFYHDHLFVPEGREQNALEILAKLAAQSK